MKEKKRGQLFLITGGSGSGKSEYAEQLVMELGGLRRLYLATMRVWDEEGSLRVERHRRQRAGKGFVTAERFTDLTGFAETLEEPFDTILVECMSNLALNEFYESEERTAERILDGVKCLRGCCRNLIIVTNEIFSDGITYDPVTERYLELLGTVNCLLASLANEVTEVIYGIPVPVKVGKEDRG
ncbi:MAG: bifunctional adenosylcobinamide kinase/adenosylcobinamide-phosphate guanylyltransferase [Clostridium sp.]|nr:bifunctional adenosylcobinamide kinase/adenosylcobinamide-phosphate guanylyltransferase [Clostridium sp.]